MHILPAPKEILFHGESFSLNGETQIVLGARCGEADLEAARLLRQDILRRTGLRLMIAKSVGEAGPNQIRLAVKDAGPQAYRLEANAGGVEIAAGESAGLFYGVQTLRQVISTEGAVIPGMMIRDFPDFPHRGLLHDVTRGKVPKLETLMELADRAAYYKLNQLQLNMEHSFAFKGLSEAWRGADPLTGEEILALDEHCRKRHIELVPALATFGHLYHILRTKTHRHLCELDADYTPFTWPDRMLHHTLDVSNPESFELVRRMLDEYIPLFSSDKFNICCDETFDLGEGKNRELAGRVGKARLYLDFLLKIIAHVKSHGKTVLFWDDIILEHPDFLPEIPQDVVCLTWQYNTPVKEGNIERIQSTGLRQYVCPGVSAWNRLAADMDGASANISKMAACAKKHGAIGILNTDWGDYGHINLLSASLPGMILGCSLAWNAESSTGAEETDGAMSALEYGDRSQSVVRLQRELGRACRLAWARFVAWYCEKFLRRTFEYPNTDGLAGVPEEEIAACYRRALGIEAEFLRLAPRVDEARRGDMAELCVAARGTALMNLMLLAIQKYDWKKDVKDTVLTPFALAEALECWFAGYETAWRARNKESELGRLRSVMFTLCDYLRDVQTQNHKN